MSGNRDQQRLQHLSDVYDSMANAIEHFSGEGHEAWARVAKLEAAAKVGEATNGGAGSNQALLTAEEREAVEDAADAAEAWGNDWTAVVLRALLERAGGE